VRVLRELRCPGRRTRRVELTLPDPVVGEADLFLPQRVNGPLPLWVVLHGITVPGRRHANLRRFAHALAATPAAVLVPDLPPWRDLQLDTACVSAALKGAVRWQARAGAALQPKPPAVVGFSVGATQALRSAALGDPPLRAVVGFGGYADIDATLRYLCTGRFRWRGRWIEQMPDPYGRWIFAARFLPLLDDVPKSDALPDALLTLAREAGTRGLFAGDPALDPLKAQLRARLPTSALPLWDLLAPPTGARPPLDEAEDLAWRLAAAAQRHRPDLDPRPLLARVTAPVVLAHGRADRLVPFPETLTLAAGLPPGTLRACTVLGMLAHSGRAGARPLTAVREGSRLLRLLDRTLPL